MSSADSNATIEALERRLALAPDDEALTLQLAALHLRDDAPGEALGCLKRLLRRRPGARQARQMLRSAGLTSWPCYRAHASRSGHSQALALRERPVVRWSWESRHEDQTLIGPPVVAGGHAVVVTVERQHLGGFEPALSRLVCVDLETGVQRWSQRRTCIPSTPVIDGDQVVWGGLVRRDEGIASELMSFALDTGEIGWHCPAPLIEGRAPYDTGHLLIDRGRVYAASNGFRPGFRPDGGFLTVVDATSGALLDHLPLVGARTPSARADGAVIFYCDDELVRSYRPGEGLSTMARAISPYLNMSCPVASEAGVFMMAEGESGARLLRLREGACELIWRSETEGTFAHAPCVGADGALYIATTTRRISGEAVVLDGNLYGLDPVSGQALRQRVEPWRPTSSPVMVEDVLLLCGELTEARQTALGHQLPPDLIGDVVIPNEEGGDYLSPGPIRRSLSAFDTRSGLEPLWRLPIPDHLSATIEPVAVADMILVQYGPGRLVALASDA